MIEEIKDIPLNIFQDFKNQLNHIVMEGISDERAFGKRSKLFAVKVTLVNEMN